MQGVALWGHHLWTNIAQNKLHKVRQAGLRHRLYWGKGELRGPGLAGEGKCFHLLPSSRRGVCVHRKGSHPPVNLPSYEASMGEWHRCGEQGDKLLSARQVGFRFGVPVV